MKFRHCLCCILMIPAILCGCAKAGPDEAPEGEIQADVSESVSAAVIEAAENSDTKSGAEISERDDISFYVIEAAYNGAEICIENNSGSAVYPASGISVEKKTGGEWYTMKPAYTDSYSGRIWESKPIYLVESGDSGKSALNWSGYYGDLPEGDYRIVREFFSDSSFSSGNITLACEFSVTSSSKTIEAIQAEMHEKELEEVWNFVAAASAEIGEKSDAKISERNDVFYSVTEASSDHIITSIENNGETTLYWGSDSSIEKNADGEWYTLIPIELPEDFASVSYGILYSSEPGDTRTEGFYWSWHYGNLEPGHYRVVKQFYFDDRSSPLDFMTLAAEFTIEQPERDYAEEFRKAEEAEKIYADKLTEFFQSEECLNAEWEFGMYMSIGADRTNHAVILWNEDDLGNFFGTAFDISGDKAKNIGTFAADISEDGNPTVIAGRLHGTSEKYFMPIIKTEKGCKLMRYPFSDDSIGEGEVIAEFEGDISGHRQEAAEILADYWNRYLHGITLRHDFERDKAVSDPYYAAGSAKFYEDRLSYLYSHEDYLLLPETVRTNGISVHMREEDVLAALGDPDSEKDYGMTDDGYLKIYYYGDDSVTLFLDEPSGIWLVDSYGFHEFTTSIGINSGMTRQELLDSEIGGKLRVPYYDHVDDSKTIENSGSLTTGEWKYGEIGFVFDGDIIVHISADNGTSI